MLFNVSIEGRWPELIIVLLLGNIGISSVGTLLGCIVHEVGATNLLLGVLVMAVLMPMMIPAVFALLLLFSPANSQMVFSIVTDFKGAVGYMAAFDAIFVTVCWLLFGVVIKQ
jgi:ABC-type transport system involved in cytochrome c biogenesis permease component